MRGIHLETPSPGMLKTSHCFDCGRQGVIEQATNILPVSSYLWSGEKWWWGDRPLAGQQKQAPKNVPRLDPGTQSQDGISGIGV